MWRECRKCGWWQRGARACQACGLSGSSWPASKPRARGTSSSNTPTLSMTLLQERWDLARQSAQNPKHVKIENSAANASYVTMGAKDICRGCQSDLSNGMRILPGQWPPLHCPHHLLERYEKTGQPTPMETGGRVSTGTPHWWHGSSRARTPAASPLALPAQSGEAAPGETYLGVAQRRVCLLEGTPGRHPFCDYQRNPDAEAGWPNAGPSACQTQSHAACQDIGGRTSSASRTDSGPCPCCTATGHRDRIPCCPGGLQDPVSHCRGRWRRTTKAQGNLHGSHDGCLPNPAAGWRGEWTLGYHCEGVGSPCTTTATTSCPDSSGRPPLGCCCNACPKPISWWDNACAATGGCPQPGTPCQLCLPSPCQRTHWSGQAGCIHQSRAVANSASQDAAAKWRSRSGLHLSRRFPDIPSRLSNTRSWKGPGNCLAHTPHGIFAASRVQSGGSGPLQLMLWVSSVVAPSLAPWPSGVAGTCARTEKHPCTLTSTLLYSPPLLAQLVFWVWISGFSDSRIMFTLFSSYLICGSPSRSFHDLARFWCFFLWCVRGKRDNNGSVHSLCGRLAHPAHGQRIGEASNPGPPSQPDVEVDDTANTTTGRASSQTSAAPRPLPDQGGEIPIQDAHIKVKALSGRTISLQCRWMKRDSAWKWYAETQGNRLQHQGRSTPGTVLHEWLQIHDCHLAMEGVREIEAALALHPDPPHGPPDSDTRLPEATPRPPNPGTPAAPVPGTPRLPGTPRGLRIPATPVLATSPDERPTPLLQALAPDPDRRRCGGD